MPSSEDSFPREARVVLKGLVKAPDLNGKVGIVRSGLTNGRQHIYIEELDKSVGLKVSNMEYEPRSVDSLSVKELKTLLKSQVNNMEDAELTGLDKSDLQNKVTTLDLSPQDISKHLAQANAEKSSGKSASTMAAAATTNHFDPAQAHQAADQLMNMSPEHLRQQARMMRTMDPDTIRRTNPQLAHMTNAQIQMAATQMEMMANNPQMMKMASEQIKNMSPEEIRQQMQQEQQKAASAAAANNTTGTPPTPNTHAAAKPSGSSSVTPDQAEQAAKMMENMTPEQMKQQADMLKTMDPDSVRRMNPQLAHMSDDEIKMAASQFEMMASNPAMMKMAMDQMKQMTPEQRQAMASGTGVGGGGVGGFPASKKEMRDMVNDPFAVLGDLDPAQLKAMAKSILENPSMIQSLADQSDISQDQVKKGFEIICNVPDKGLARGLWVVSKAQKARVVWKKVDAKINGQLLNLVIVVAVVMFGLLIKYFFFRHLPPEVIMEATTVPDIPIIMEKAEATTEDEFASEF